VLTHRIVEEQRLNTLPLLERQQRLAEIVSPNKSVQLVQLHSDGEALFHAIRPQHMEGIVAKNIHTLNPSTAKITDGLRLKITGMLSR
jgi:ATP-dependent DNA ligase